MARGHTLDKPDGEYFSPVFTAIPFSIYLPGRRQTPPFFLSYRFSVLHPEKLPSAINRYVNEVHRVLGVLNTALEGKEWLVGDKCTLADLSFLPWNNRVNMTISTPQGEDPLAPYPNVQAWQQRMEARDSWKKAMEVRAKLMDDQGLQVNGMPKGITNIKEYEEHIAKTAAEEGKA